MEKTRGGYRLRDAVTGEVVRHDDPRIRVIKLAGSSYRLDALQDDGFAPGKRLALVLSRAPKRSVPDGAALATEALASSDSVRIR